MKYKTYKNICSDVKIIAHRALCVLTIAVAMVGIVCISLVLMKDNAAAETTEHSPDNNDVQSVESFVPIDCELPYELQEYTYYISRSYGVDFELVMAVMYTESSFDVAAISYTGDRGLMQINDIAVPELADKLYITDISDPYQNIRAGVYILADYVSRYDDLSRVLMSYNMGEYGAATLWNEGIHSTSYTEKVLKKFKEFTI